MNNFYLLYVRETRANKKISLAVFVLPKPKLVRIDLSTEAIINFFWLGNVIKIKPTRVMRLLPFGNQSDESAEFQENEVKQLLVGSLGI